MKKKAEISKNVIIVVLIIIIILIAITVVGNKLISFRSVIGMG